MPQLTVQRRDGRPGRAGFSLVEVLVALTMLGIVGAALIATITRQQQFYRDASGTMTVRRELRSGASILPTELRSVSRAGNVAGTQTDILETTERRMRFRATTGSSIICEKGAGIVTSFVIPPPNLARHTLTAWYEMPAVGDQVAIFNEGPLTGAEDDDWHYATIVGVSTSTSACFPSPYMDDVLDAPASKPRYRITVAALGGLPADIKVGAVVRFLREVQYQLYQPSGSNRWFLGYQQQVNNTWTAMAPVAGPYRGPGEDGLRFQFYDTTGAVTADRDRISRVDVMLKGQADRAVARERRGTPFRDSLLFRIGVRNFK